MIYTCENIIKNLKSHGNRDNLVGMKRYGIEVSTALGVTMPYLRSLAKTIKRNHQLAQELWNTNVHEARILAGLIDDPKQVTKKQIIAWTNDFDSWDICDGVCNNLFNRTPFAFEMAYQFSASKREFVKRAGFVLMATLTVHAKKEPDERFLEFLPIIERESCDERNFVKKAVNWALRQAGKRNEQTNIKALECAHRILLQDSKAAKWIARDAIRELEQRTFKK
ncbi:MAG: DNA alkylation repair protein [Bacteroidota bacterium]